MSAQQRGMGGSEDTRSSFYARTPFEKEMQHEIVCTCGGCGHQNLAECRKDACGTAHEMRGELAAMIDKGMKHDEIIQAFVTRYGSQEMLGAPIDQGFNRLAWLVPYVVGGAGIVLVGVAASRWSHRAEPTDPTSRAADPDMEQRLDDELRDLD